MVRAGVALKENVGTADMRCERPRNQNRDEKRTGALDLQGGPSGGYAAANLRRRYRHARRRSLKSTRFPSPLEKPSGSHQVETGRQADASKAVPDTENSSCRRLRCARAA